MGHEYTVTPKCIFHSPVADFLLTAAEILYLQQVLEITNVIYSSFFFILKSEFQFIGKA